LTVSNLPVAELTSTILNKIGDQFLDMKGQKIRNLDSPTAISDGATMGYVDPTVAAAVAAVKATVSTAPAVSVVPIVLADDVLTRY
jgi:hypothetical protein